VTKHALDPLSSTPRVHVGVSAGKGAHGVAGILADEATDAAFPADGALGFQLATSTIGDMASIDADLTGAPGAAVAELLARRTAIGVGFAIVVEGIAG
jgi:hypothetical protein